MIKKILLTRFISWSIVLYQVSEKNNKKIHEFTVQVAERGSMGFSLNDFLWIQGIQWIMTKSKTGMDTRGITQLVVGVLPVIVIQIVFSLLPLGRYLLPLTTLNSYQPIDSYGKFSFTTTASNVPIVKYRMSLVTIPPLDLVIIHWFRWIHRKSFRENSNDFSLPFS